VTRIATTLLSALLLGWLAGCGSSETTVLPPAPENPFAVHAVGDDASFEAITWNLHNFAEDANSKEVALVAQAIAGMGADVVALQEIAQPARFDQMLEQLPGWSGYQAESDRYQNLGYVWLDSTVTVHAVREIFTGDGLAFPRSPLVLEVSWGDLDVLLINNHLKCCGDGQLDTSDEGDEETRRLAAMQQLEAWIDAEHPDDPVILLGDLNDLLTDPEPHNVFEPVLSRPDLYAFADLAVAEGPAAGWSWGPGQSHLDHILVTDELFGALAADGAACYTVLIDRTVDGSYRDQMSDHLPVVVVLPGAALP
jgi:endonuclease/exonuclease/phosphatase family metal-dependent hydrolase